MIFKVCGDCCKFKYWDWVRGKVIWFGWLGLGLGFLGRVWSGLRKWFCWVIKWEESLLENY
ncbi:hypothetical protein, partial [Staphylococcus hominis]|uniref:hypothetical protein n=1 Tax=Staphylococcus hominis TaxID=1290 RepID=UPI001C9305A0